MEAQEQEPNSSPTHLTYAFFSMDPPARTQIGTLIYAEQKKQTFLCTPTGVQTSVRSRGDHTSKQTTKLKAR